MQRIDAHKYTDQMPHISHTYHLEVYENSINVLKGCFRSNYKGHILQSIQMLIPILRASTKVH